MDFYNKMMNRHINKPKLSSDTVVCCANDCPKRNECKRYRSPGTENKTETCHLRIITCRRAIHAQFPYFQPKTTS